MRSHYQNMITFVWVRDLQRALSFYQGVLGMDRVFEAAGWCELALPGTRNAFLALNHWTRDGEPPHNGFVTFGVDALDDFREHLRKSGVELKGDVIELHEHGLRMLKFYDPDGNVLTLAEVER